MSEFVTVQNALLGALALAGGFGWRWLDRMQSQHDKLAESFGKLKEKILEEYAKKTDVNDGDKQILEQIKQMSAQLDRINDKLAGKKDKSDG